MVGDAHERQHDGDFRQHADGRRERGRARHAEQRDGHGDGELEEIRGADKAGWGGNIKGQAQQIASAVGQAEDQEGLQDERHGNQHDVQGILEDDLCLGTEDDDERQQQAPGRHAVEAVDEDLVEVRLPLAVDDGEPRENASNQRDDDEQEDAEKQHVVGHGDVGDAEQELDDRHEGHEDDQIVRRDLDDCVGRIAARQRAPDKDHGRAGRCA